MAANEWFTFSSDAALNLHHLVYAEAREAESASLRGSSRLDHAIAFYRSDLVERDLLFDDTMRDLSLWLVGGGGGAPDGFDEAFSPLLDEYVGTDWPAHDRHTDSGHPAPMTISAPWSPRPWGASNRHTASHCPIHQ